MPIKNQISLALVIITKIKKSILILGKDLKNIIFVSIENKDELKNSNKITKF